MKKILVPMDATDTASVALETAFVLATAFKSLVLTLHVPTAPSVFMPPVGEGMSEDAVGHAFRRSEMESRERSKTTRNRFDQIRERMGIPLAADETATNGPATLWKSESGYEERIVTRLGRLSDLIVISRATPDSRPAADEVLNAAMFQTARPVLLAGSSAIVSAPKKIAIAWNGGQEATRAVAGAMPIIKQAESILVLTAESSRTRADAAGELVHYLALHGLKAESRIFPKSHERPVPQALSNECSDEGVDMLIMGAFSHNRMREFILGGVTRHVISGASIPILMAH